MDTFQGHAYPMGLSFSQNKVNFSLYAPHAKSCDLQLYDKNDILKCVVKLDPKINKTGHIWHIELKLESIQGLDYLYLIDHEKLVLDPYAKFLNTSNSWLDGAKPVATKATVRQEDFFDWGGDACPNIKMKDLVIYEMHVRSFTINADVKHPGTFLGIIEKIPYLKSLGINAIELMPIHEFNECEVPFEGLCNYWGYSPIAYFAFMARYGAKDGEVLNEFKTLVKELHKHDIAVIIDVVYNHTAEGGKTGPTYHFKALDPHYYITDSSLNFIDFTGCGNTLDANRFPSKHLILESLKYLACVCHVDGFRFDLGSTFFRNQHGYVPHPTIITEIQQDPVLSQKLLIAEAWDAAGLYQVGKFPKPFADWNGFYRDRVRAFLRNDDHSKGGFADAISGSASLYFEKTPDLSINFITAHDGFTLNDLFSYNHKHNLANLENNRDGCDNNISWNLGHEGLCDDPLILKSRYNLRKLSFAILLLSLGTPMLLMGDEYGHSRSGNNNAWCQDNSLNYFLWDRQDPTMIYLIQSLIKLRREIKALHNCHFLTKEHVTWHGTNFDDPAWNTNDGFLSYLIDKRLLVMFNASNSDRTLMLPSGEWTEALNTEKTQPQMPLKIDTSHFVINSYSCIVLKRTDL